MQDKTKNSQSPQISVIVPVYNVEKWLDRFYESLNNQTFKNFDVWMVDDGSTDKSGKICESIESKDNRFHVIHQKNAGAAAARNTAFPHAKGKYYYFMDPDDWAENTMLEDMFNFGEKNGLELVVTGFYIDTYYEDNKYYRECKNCPDAVYKSQQDFRQNSHKLYDGHLLYTPWNKLYLREYLMKHNIKFPENEFWDDLLFNLEVLKEVEKVGCLSQKYYHFLRARSESETAKYRANLYEKREDENNRIFNLYKNWGIQDDNTMEFIDRRYSERLIGCIENLTNKACTLPKREIKKQIKKMISTKHAQRAIRNTKPHTTMMKLMLFPLKHRLVWLSYIECKFITFVKTKNTKVFAKLKANR